MRVGKLGSVNVLLADTEYELYKLTEENSFSVVTVTGVNRGIAPVKMSIGIKDANGNVYWLENDVEILQKNVIVRTSVNLSTGDTIICKSNADQCNFVCTGSQSSDALADVAAPALQSSNTLVESSPTASNFYGTAVTTTTSFYATSAPGAGTVEVNSVDDTPIVSVVNSVTNAATDRYGEALDISDFYLAVGAPGETGTGGEVNAGKVYIYETFSGSLLHTLVSPNEGIDQFFGTSIAIDSVNNKLYVGEPGVNTNNVYRYTLSTGAYDSVLSNPGTNGIEFGHSLALSPSGSQLVVGAPNTNTGQGAVYVLDTATMAAGAAIPGTVVLADEGDDYFPLRMGSAVATDGTNIFMGGPTSTRGPDNIGVVQVKNMSGAPVADIVSPAGFEQADMEFGAGITVNSELLIISAPGYDSDSGYAFAYLNDGNLFERVADVAPPESTARRFGESVDASDAKILLGAPEATVSSETNAGAVYSYRENNTRYTNRNVTATLTATSTSIDQTETVELLFTVDLPYSSNAGFEFNWSVTGFTGVVSTVGVTGSLGNVYSGTATTNSSGQIAFTLNTADRTVIDYFDQGNQTIVFSVGNETETITIIPQPPELFSFSTTTFSSPRTDETGPSLTQARSSMQGTGITEWNTNTEYFNVVNGIQYWTVPADGTYRITARGGKPPNAGNYAAGRPSKVVGDFDLTKGQVLHLLAGQAGIVGGHSQNSGQRVSAGGGGSFVTVTPHTTTASLLLAAGGGGGAADNTWTRRQGRDASTTTSGTTGASGGVSGGSNGSGGSGTYGGGGAGFSGNGATPSGTSSTEVAQSYTNGGGGGDGAASWGIRHRGGFGGGGGGGSLAAGGGGGYSGGGAGDWSSQQQGGGGGSYANATLGTNTSVSLTTETGNGYVTIQRIA